LGHAGLLNKKTKKSQTAKKYFGALYDEYAEKIRHESDLQCNVTTFISLRFYPCHAV
jgi:hypothetical protein